METKTKSERVKWRVSKEDAGLVTDEVGAVVADCAYDEDARQIVHEHNTWGELLEALKDLVAGCRPDYSDRATRRQDAVNRGIAAIAAAEKEEG